MIDAPTPPSRREWARRYAAFEDCISGICLVLGLTLILYGVIMRYVFSMPLYWIDEVSTYLAVWGGIFGWSVAERDRRHIRVTLIFDSLPRPARRWAALASTAVSAAFCLFLAYMAGVLEARYFTSGQLTLNTQLPLWIVHAAMPVAALMLGGRYLAQSIDLMRFGVPADDGKPPAWPLEVVSR